MQTACGECKKPYSKKCQQKQPCKIHNKFCFQCLQCKEGDANALQICFSCGQVCKAEQSFLDIRCFNYLCKRQFTTLNLTKDQVLLPCGCLQMKQHVVSFMSNFCITCLRTLSQPKLNQMGHCRLCLQKMNEHAKNAKIIKQQSQKTFLQQWISKAKQQKVQLTKGTQQARQNQKLIIKLLNQDFKKVQQQLQISEFTRLQLKKQILQSQRDTECIICTLPYTLLRKPMMICMQQHLICEKCFTQKLTLVSCPLCFELVQRDKVRASRERLRTLQLESIMSQKYQNKQKRYLALCSSNVQELRYKYEIKDAQIQTDLPNKKEQLIAEQPLSLKRPKFLSKPQNGRKRRNK